MSGNGLRNYKIACNYFDEQGYKYKRDEEDLSIITGFGSDDIPIDLVIGVKDETDTIVITSRMPFEVKEEKRIDVALAVVAANFGRAYGVFDFNLDNGNIYFKLNDFLLNGDLNEELLDVMLTISLHVVDEYNDKFLALATGLMNVKEFLEWNNSKN